MAFDTLKNWNANQTHIDPRIIDNEPVGAKYAVVSIIKYPTYREMKLAGKSIAESRMVGLIQNFMAPQVRPIVRFFELGSRYPYSVPGKFVGTIQMSSMMFDAGANLIGGIYEEVFRDLNADPYSGYNLDADGRQLLNTPKLYENGRPKIYDGTMVGGPAGGVQKDWGAIRMSIDDNRLDRPFGLVLSIFQSGRRIKNSSIDVPQSGTDDINTYRIMSCLFFEMVKIQNYDFQLGAEQEVITESAGFYYTGLVNVKTTLQSSPSTFGGRNEIDITPNNPIIPIGGGSTGVTG